MLVSKKETSTYSKYVFFKNGQFEKRYKFLSKYPHLFEYNIEKMPFVQKYYKQLDIMFDYEITTTGINIQMDAVDQINPKFPNVKIEVLGNTHFHIDFLQWLKLYKNSLKNLQIIGGKKYIGMNDCKPENFRYNDDQLIWIDEDNFSFHNDVNVAKLNCLHGIYTYLRAKNYKEYNESHRITVLGERISQCVMEIFDD
tara:strand:- start:1894 stop:2487 length:594 start_codon:yes stop_codon:yes gene_type:complete